MEEGRFDAIAWRIYGLGIRPNHLTFGQIPVYVAQVYAGIVHDPWLFLWLQVPIILLDGGDGILARRTGSVSRRGHLLDSIFDLLGIGVTAWVAAQMYAAAPSLPFIGLPELLLIVVLVNALVYYQNEVQGTKAITYARGPLTLGIVLEQYWEGLLLVGVLLPLLIGVTLLFTRVALRQRLWNWYQFLTAGRRREYKALPRSERAASAGHPSEFPPPHSDPAEPADDERPGADRSESPRA